jgi:hypothetical protein
MQKTEENLPHSQPENCVGPRSDTAGKAAACQGCPNQSICSSGVLKAPDPGKFHYLLLQY